MRASGETSFAKTTPRAEQIARLNDTLRKTAVGGQIVVTRGVAGLTGYATETLMAALGASDRFDIDNDPHGERDFGDIDYLGAELLWKIDYYDLDMVWASPDPADPQVTTRVLTIMLAEEY